MSITEAELNIIFKDFQHKGNNCRLLVGDWVNFWNKVEVEIVKTNKVVPEIEETAVYFFKELGLLLQRTRQPEVIRYSDHTLDFTVELSGQPVAILNNELNKIENVFQNIASFTHENYKASEGYINHMLEMLSIFPEVFSKRGLDIISTLGSAMKWESAHNVIITVSGIDNILRWERKITI